MNTITANFPARKATWAGKSHVYQAHTGIYTQDEKGRWSIDGNAITEADVIDDCKRASNWHQIMVVNFPMLSAALQSGE